MAYKNIALLGASGNIGKAILEQLVKDGSFNITIISRSDSSATFDSDLSVVRCDYAKEDELVKAFSGQDVVIAALNSRNPAIIAGQKGLIDAAVKAGVKRFIPSEFGSDTTNPITLEICPFLKGKVETVQHLQAQEPKGLSWSAIVNGGFFDWGLLNGHMGFNIQNHTGTLWDAKKPGQVTFTNFAQIGRAVVGILKNPQQTANRYIYVSSFLLTGQELLDALRKDDSTEWTITEASTHEAEKKGVERLQAGDRPAAVPLLLKALTWRKDAGYDYSLTKSDNELLGLPRESLEETIASVRQGQLAR